MSGWTFARQCLRRALSTGWGAASFISLVVTIIGGAFSWKWPQMGEVANLWMWLGPLAALVFFMFMGALHAAFAMWRERDQLANKNERGLQEEIVRLKAQIEKAENKHSVAAEMATKKALAHSAFNKLRQELKELADHSTGARPREGTNESMPRLERAFAENVKKRLLEWLERARTEAEKVSLDGYLAQIGEVANLPLEIHGIDKSIQLQTASVEAILKQLA